MSDCPSGANARAPIEYVCPNSWSGVPLAGFQSVTTCPSATARVLLSGEKVDAKLCHPRAGSVCRNLPAPTSQTWVDPAEAAASVLPSGENARESVPFLVWPVHAGTSWSQGIGVEIASLETLAFFRLCAFRRGELDAVRGRRVHVGPLARLSDHTGACTKAQEHEQRKCDSNLARDDGFCCAVSQAGNARCCRTYGSSERGANGGPGKGRRHCGPASFRRKGDPKLTARHVHSTTPHTPPCP